MDSAVLNAPLTAEKQQFLRCLLLDLLLLTGMNPHIGYVRQVDAVTNPPDPVFQAKAYLQHNPLEARLKRRDHYIVYGLLLGMAGWMPGLARELGTVQFALFLALLAVTAFFLYHYDRRLQRIRDLIANEHLADFWLDKIMFGQEEIALILRKAPWPWARLFLGRPPLTQRQRVKLLTYNLSWYLKPARLYFPLEWLTILLALTILLLCILGAIVTAHTSNAIAIAPILLVNTFFLVSTLGVARSQSLLIMIYIMEHIHKALSMPDASRATQ